MDWELHFLVTFIVLSNSFGIVINHWITSLKSWAPRVCTFFLNVQQKGEILACDQQQKDKSKSSFRHMKHYNFHWILIGDLETIRAKLIIVLMHCDDGRVTDLSAVHHAVHLSTNFTAEYSDWRTNRWLWRWFLSASFWVFSASGNIAAHEGWVARAKQLIIVKAEKTNSDN